MKKLLFPILVGCLSVSFTYRPSTTVACNSRAVTSTASGLTENITSPVDKTAVEIYENASLKEAGLTSDAFQYAWKGYQYLLSKKAIAHSRYITICDFSLSSRQKRFFIIDIERKELIARTYVAHGKNSGAEFATQFSNRAESLQSSLGFYVTANTYLGKHGTSLRLIGVDGKFNDQALARTIVIHGASYVNATRVANGGYMGRSWGCPALPESESTSIINTIKGGTCLFIYHPGANYLLGSKILNG